MSVRIRTMGAGATTRTSRNQGGGDKKQGLVSTATNPVRLSPFIRVRGGGHNRNWLFCMNQLGGVGRRWGQASGPGNRGGVSANCQRLAYRRRQEYPPKPCGAQVRGWGQGVKFPSLCRPEVGSASATPMGNDMAAAYLVQPPDGVPFPDSGGVYYCYTIGSSAWTADTQNPDQAKAEPTYWLYTLNGKDPTVTGTWSLWGTAPGWTPGDAHEFPPQPGTALGRWTITNRPLTKDPAGYAGSMVMPNQQGVTFTVPGTYPPEVAFANAARAVSPPYGYVVTPINAPSEPFGRKPAKNEFNRMTKWTGVNLAGFDYGTLARAGGAWCTDEVGDTGGWSDPNVGYLTPGYAPTEVKAGAPQWQTRLANCPNYATCLYTNPPKGQTEAPTCGENSVYYGQDAYEKGPPGDFPKPPTPFASAQGQANANTYRGGLAASSDFTVATATGNLPTTTDATSTALGDIPEFARGFTPIDEVIAAIAFGVNVFRIPFRIEMISQLWPDTWMVQPCDLGQDTTATCTEWLPPSRYYLQMVVDYVEAIFKEAAKQEAMVSVIFDMHNYMRWCPLGIGGTFSCLEGAGFSSKQYAGTITDKACSACGTVLNSPYCMSNGANADRCMNAGGVPSGSGGAVSKAAMVASGRGAKIQKYPAPDPSVDAGPPTCGDFIVSGGANYRQAGCSACPDTNAWSWWSAAPKDTQVNENGFNGQCPAMAGISAPGGEGTPVPTTNLSQWKKNWSIAEPDLPVFHTKAGYQLGNNSMTSSQWRGTDAWDGAWKDVREAAIDSQICTEGPTPDKLNCKFDGTPDYEMDPPGGTEFWGCPLDFKTAPTQFRSKTCGLQRNGKVAGEAPNPYATVLGGECFKRIWVKLLGLPAWTKESGANNYTIGQWLQSRSEAPDAQKPDPYPPTDTPGYVMIGLMNEPNMVDTQDLADAYTLVIPAIRDAGVTNRLLVMGNYWGGLHAQMTPAARYNGTFLGRGKTPATPGAEDPSQVNGGSVTQGTTKTPTAPMKIICDAVSALEKAGLWTYDLHQYFDFNSTGNWDCEHGWVAGSGGEGGDSPQTPGAFGTLGAIVEFTNFAKLLEYARTNEVSLAVTEFGGHVSPRCFKWMAGFLNMLSMAGPVMKPSTSGGMEEVGGVIAWTGWRVAPHTSWYGSIGNDSPNQDCIFFATPAHNEPMAFKNLHGMTSDWAPGAQPTCTGTPKDSSTKNCSLKQAMYPFMSTGAAPAQCEASKCGTSFTACLTDPTGICRAQAKCAMACNTESCMEDCADGSPGAAMSALIKCAVAQGCVTGAAPPAPLTLSGFVYESKSSALAPLHYECLHATSHVSVIDSNGNKYLLNGALTYDQSLRLALSAGTYRLTNIPPGHPMAICIYGLEHAITYTGDAGKRIQGYKDGYYYDFYYGDITVTVTGNFGSVSIYCNNHGYMGGEDLLVYSEDCVTGY